MSTLEWLIKDTKTDWEVLTSVYKTALHLEGLHLVFKKEKSNIINYKRLSHLILEMLQRQ